MDPRPSHRIEVPADARDLPGDFRFRRPIEVRFGDTDAMGHVNNALYLTYCEAARVSYFEAATGRSFLEAGRGGESDAGPDRASRFSFILAEARLVYRAPAYFGETLVVECRTSRVGRTSMTMEYRLTAPESHLAGARLIAVGDSVQVGYDYERGRPVGLPPELVAHVEAYEGRRLRA